VRGLQGSLGARGLGKEWPRGAAHGLERRGVGDGAQLRRQARGATLRRAGARATSRSGRGLLPYAPV
jgi:hypothetical protein